LPLTNTPIEGGGVDKEIKYKDDVIKAGLFL